MTSYTGRKTLFSRQLIEFNPIEKELIEDLFFEPMNNFFNSSIKERIERKNPKPVNINQLKKSLDGKINEFISFDCISLPQIDLFSRLMCKQFSPFASSRTQLKEALAIILEEQSVSKENSIYRSHQPQLNNQSILVIKDPYCVLLQFGSSDDISSLVDLDTLFLLQLKNQNLSKTKIKRIENEIEDETLFDSTNPAISYLDYFIPLHEHEIGLGRGGFSQLMSWEREWKDREEEMRKRHRDLLMNQMLSFEFY